MHGRLRLATIGLFVLACLQGQNVHAALVVGNCVTGSAHFTTIQAAVNAAPSGATIQVCPGTYPEQIVISAPLTLKGVQVGNSGAAVITLPPAFTTYPQILVLNTTDVTLNNLTINSTNGSGPCAGVPEVMFNLSSGTIKNMVLRGQPGCNTTGAWAVQNEQGSVAILNNSFQQSSICVIDIGNTTIKGNSVEGGSGILVSNLYGCPAGPSASIASPLLATQFTATISDNVVANSDGGIAVRLFGPGTLTVKENTVIDSAGVGPFNGIVLDQISAAVTVTSNTVVGSPVGIYLTDVSGSFVQNNTIMDSTLAGVFVTFDSTGNTITSNTINGACAGMLNNEGTFFALNTTTPNTYFNVVNIQQNGASCP